MIIAIDIGNTNIVIGGYQNDKIAFIARMATDHRFEADQYAIELQGIFELYNVSVTSLEGIIISSVVPRLTAVLMRALSHFSKKEPHLLSLRDAKHLHIAIENPPELGMDILSSAIVVAATRPLPAVIIDMGTATKLTAIDANGALQGVAIAPGLFVSLDALLDGASLLRGISLDAPSAAIGRNTSESMKSGVLLGTASMLDGMIDRFAAELGGVASIVATGGAASVVIPHCRHTIELCDTLLLDGLYLAYKNRKSN